jgi:DNA-binding SARP family transcriptional activator
LNRQLARDEVILPAGRGRRLGSGLRLRLLGGFAAWVDDAPVDEGEWRRRKVGRLVKLLALAPGHTLHRDQVIDVLWPDLEPRAAAQNLHHTLYRARRALEPALERRGEPRFLRLREDMIELASPGELDIDLVRFERAALIAFASPYDVDLHREAVCRFGGELLPGDRFEDWAIDRRDEVQARYFELLLSLAEHERERGDLETALEALKRIVAVEPLHEEAQAMLIHLDGLAGRRHLAVAHYQRFRELLRRRLGAEPLPTTTEVYERVISGELCRRRDVRAVAVAGPRPRLVDRRALAG